MSEPPFLKKGKSGGSMSGGKGDHIILFGCNTFELLIIYKRCSVRTNLIYFYKSICSEEKEMEI